jgi:glycosyltransferase involved in cell wall biosynthesis
MVNIDEEFFYRCVNQHIDKGEFKDALALLNGCTATSVEVLQLRIKLFEQMQRPDLLLKMKCYENALKFLEPELQKVPYSLEASTYLFRTLARQRNLTKKDRDHENEQSEKLILYGTIFPRLSCTFSTVEYNAYLKHFPNSLVFTNGVDFTVGGNYPGFEKVLSDYEKVFPQYGGRTFKTNVDTDFRGKLFYTIFLSNIYHVIDYVEACETPFVFTLYLGGEWCVGNSNSDKMLQRVVKSPFFRKVIVVDSKTYSYIIDHNFVSEGDVIYIPGWLVPTEELQSKSKPKLRFSKEKETFDLCFVAMKSMPLGRNKGYDVFIEVAHKLSQLDPRFRFHVAGGFGPQEIDVTRIRDKIQFYGVQGPDFFPDFYRKMDVMLSPNLPGVLAKGHIEGAPNVTNIEAGLCGTLVMMTDQLNLNTHFKDKEEVIIIPHDPIAITEKILYYFHHLDELYEIAARGQTAFARVCSYESVIRPRIKVLEEVMSEVKEKTLPISAH